MTSQEIALLKIKAESAGSSEECRWLREIAYQLAKMNEAPAELLKKLKADRLADPEPIKNYAQAERGEYKLGWYWVWYDSTWILAEWDGEDWNIVNGAVVPRRHVVCGFQIAGPPLQPLATADHAPETAVRAAANDSIDIDPATLQRQEKESKNG